MKFNEDQESAYKSIYNFIKSKNKIFALTGPAGCGKTTVISSIFNNPIFNTKKIVLAATTNKAVSVIEQMFDRDSQHKNIDFCTIHKICNIKRKIDHDGIETFNFDESPAHNKNQKSIYNYDIIVIDEASMINLSLLKYLNSIKHKIRGKFIFVGDIYQLPPVNEVDSMAFNREYCEDTYRLSKIERFKSNILNFSIRIRESIDKNTQISIKNIEDDSFTIFKKNQELWMDDYLKEFSYNNIFLAYTNKRCNDINNYIRNKYFKGAKVQMPLPEYIKDELIVFNNYYNVVNDGDDLKFYTSNNAKIIQCDSTNYTIPSFPIDSLLNLKKKMVVDYKIKKTSGNESIEDECPICYEKIKDVDNILETDCKHIFCEDCIRMWLEENKTCPFCRMKIVENKLIINKDPVLTEKLNKLVELTSNKIFKLWNLQVESNTNSGNIVVIKSENIKQFNKHKEDIKFAIGNIKNYIYKNLKRDDNRFILKRFWEYYYINYIDYFADISYGYCITVHKSQGSTFKKVYIDAKNILEYNKKDGINYKCLYTAITRGSDKVLMFV